MLTALQGTQGHTDSWQALKGGTFFNSGNVNFTFHHHTPQQNTEHLPTIAATERVNTMAATMITIRVI